MVQIVGFASKGSKGSKGEERNVDDWKRSCFGWEYKRKGEYRSLVEAHRQLYQ